MVYKVYLVTFVDANINSLLVYKKNQHVSQYVTFLLVILIIN